MNSSFETPGLPTWLPQDLFSYQSRLTVIKGDGRMARWFHDPPLQRLREPDDADGR